MRGRLAAGAGLLAAAVVLAAAVQAQSPPEGGHGRDVLQVRCLACHDADLIVQQRLARQAWVREVDKMVAWGAFVPAEDREALVDYLAASFGVTPMASHAADGAGEAIYTRSCLICHDADLIAQQRLSRTGWEREVDKMVGWGAPVAAADKAPLVDFLLARFAR